MGCGLRRSGSIFTGDTNPRACTGSKRSIAVAIHECGENLFLVDLDLPREGFRRFISSWVYRPDDLTILVDPGPRASIPVLASALETLGIGRIDYILLTHIHVDHAGGAGLLLERYSSAQVLCHPQGIRHMIDPAKLWEGSRKVLAEIADLYGEIAPVAAGNIGYRKRIEAGGLLIDAFETPGHASHHLCFRIGGVLFAGEVAGITYPLDGGLYLRQATPPPFSYDIYRSSIKLAAASEASLICFGHWGCRRDGAKIFSLALEQLDAWLAIVGRHLERGSDPCEDAVFADFLAHDRALLLYPDLPADVRARERYFTGNSIRGIRDYLKAR